MWIDDDILRQCDRPLVHSVWIPRETVVIMGSSNSPDKECDSERCKKDGVPILRRYGGGGTVVLHDGCVVISIGTWMRDPYKNSTYFQLLNQAVINALAGKWTILKELEQAGISDICHKGFKVAGTSLFRSRQYLLFQVSLLVNPRIEVIESYLQHPTKEPDYRQGRPHRSFIRGLSDLVTGMTPQLVAQVLEDGIASAVKLSLGDEAIQPVSQHIPIILERAASGRDNV